MRGRVGCLCFGLMSKIHCFVYGNEHHNLSLVTVTEYRDWIAMWFKCLVSLLMFCGEIVFLCTGACRWHTCCYIAINSILPTVILSPPLWTTFVKSFKKVSMSYIPGWQIPNVIHNSNGSFYSIKWSIQCNIFRVMDRVHGKGMLESELFYLGFWQVISYLLLLI